MARKQLILDDDFVGKSYEDIFSDDEEIVNGGLGPPEVDGYGQSEGVVGEDTEAAIETLLKEVEVGEESYKTPTKGKSSVAISVQIEESAVVGVALPPPAVGMVFDSWQKIDMYFRNYGKQEGFGVVRSSGATVGKGPNAKEKRNVMWTCECYGLPGRRRKKNGSMFVSDSQISEEVHVTRKSKKVNCPVNVYANVNDHGEWVIQRAKLDHHGHEATPGKSKNITKFRKKFLMDNPHILEQLFNDRKSGVPVAKIYSCMARQQNGREEMPFTQKDLHDEVAKQRKQIFDEGDAKAMFSYFKKMVDDNSNFFHTYRVDELGRLKDVLWVDARSRAAYEEFGDVVCFDSTYLTNEYKLPFCNFVGVNHHGQTILLGCALVSHETSETFEWVFSNWLRCMGDKQPIDILTDQDAAMRKALKLTMKGTTHRWCIWHIVHKFGVKLGKYSNFNDLKEDLDRVIYDSLDCDEFESEWRDVIKKHNVEGDDWLQGLFDERHMWVPAFLKHMFWAGMKTTQRVESIHRFFDGYLSKHTLLSEFVERYCEALEVRSATEKRADDNNARYARQIYSEFPAEKIFQKLYTDAKFKKVQHECSRMIYVKGKQVNETVTEFIVEDKVWYKPKGERKERPSTRKKEYKCRFDTSNKEVTCECRFFECHGIVCRHMIKVYEMSSYYEIPDKYILRRWRKDIIRKHTRVKVAYHDPSKTEEVCRYDKMMVRFGPICSKASVSIQATNAVMQDLQLVELQVDEKLSMATNQGAGTPSSVCKEKGNNNETPLTQRQGSCDVPEEDIILDPPMPKRPPHRTTDSRYKSFLEKSMKANNKGSGSNKGAKNQATRGASKYQGKKGAQANVAHGSSVLLSGQQATTPPQHVQNMPISTMYSCSPHFGGGIQMVDIDGSIGYFTSVPGAVQQFSGSYISPHNPAYNQVSPHFIVSPASASSHGSSQAAYTIRPQTLHPNLY